MTRKREKPPQDLAELIMLISFGVVVVGIASLLLYMAARRTDFKRDAAAGHLPPFFSSAAAAQPLPGTLAPDGFQEAIVHGAYAIARLKPAILAQQPCYCGCERQGHRSLLDCFKSDHGAKCSVCIREALYTGELDAQGECPAEIREGIVRGDWKSLESSSR